MKSGGSRVKYLTRVAIDNFVVNIDNDRARWTKWNCLAVELDTEMDIVRGIMEEIAQIASFIGNPSPAAERRSSGGIAFTTGEEGDLATNVISRERRSGPPPHRDAVGVVNLGDSYSRATTDDDALVADLGFESFQVRVDSDPSQPSDPDVWPLQTPKPLRGALQGVPEAASAAVESSSYGSVSRSKRESAAAGAAALAIEKARQSLPAWARLATPPPAGEVVHRRSCGGGGGVGSGGGNGLAAAKGGASRVDAAVRGRLGFGEGGGSGLIVGSRMKPRRGSRGRRAGPMVESQPGAAAEGLRRRRGSPAKFKLVGGDGGAEERGNGVLSPKGRASRLLLPRSRPRRLSHVRDARTWCGKGAGQTQDSSRPWRGTSSIGASP